MAKPARIGQSFLGNHPSNMNDQFKITPEKEQASIVLRGNFNPTIFKPEWFANHDLLGKQEIQEAKIEIIHPHITQFQTESLNIEIQRELFVIKTIHAPFIKLNDLVLGIFGNHLPHCPINQMGINRQVIFSAGTEAAWHRTGDTLAPKEAWGEWGSKIKDKAGKRHGGLKRIILQQKPREDEYTGYIQVDLRPTEKPSYGIIIDVNDHFEIGKIEEINGASEILSILKVSFERSMKNSAWIFNQIMGQI